MLETTAIKTEASEIINLIKQLPKDKQNYISGYIHGLIDSNKHEQTEKASRERANVLSTR